MLDPNKQLAQYTAESGNEITLTPSMVRNYLTDNPNVTDQEIVMFAALCKAHSLDPTIKEVHLIKYGDRPATMVIGKDVFTKRAKRNPGYRGMNAGIIVSDGQNVTNRKGSFCMPHEQVVGGWAEVFVKDYEVPFYDSVSFEEYAGRKKDGSLNKTWAEKPATMIRKVAVVHALREAFPEEFGGMYDSAEMGVEQPDETPVEIPKDTESELAERGAEIIEEIAAGNRPEQVYEEAF